MYFDAVLVDGTRQVAFNGTREATKNYLCALNEEKRKNLTVIVGATLEMFTVEEYLKGL